MDPHEHVVQARYLLSIADHPLVAANRQHRSEILWGAATQMVKAVAKAHNLPNRSHRALIGAVRLVGTRLASDPNLITDFSTVEELHKSFYDGEMSDVEIADRHETTRQFVSKMQRILDTP